MFYSGEKSLFARLTACTWAKPATIYQFYEFGYIDLIYPDHKLIELSHFRTEIIKTLKTLQQGPIFVKFHIIPFEKDIETGIIYPWISIFQVGYIPKNFQLNIEASKKFGQICFNESWINYRRTSRAITIKCHGVPLYASELKCLL